MKRRDFLKGIVGSIAGLGASKVLGASEPESIIEVNLPTKPIHESSMIEDYRQFEVPMQFVIDNSTARKLSPEFAQFVIKSLKGVAIE